MCSISKSTGSNQRLIERADATNSRKPWRGLSSWKDRAQLIEAFPGLSKYFLLPLPAAVFLNKAGGLRSGPGYHSISHEIAGLLVETGLDYLLRPTSVLRNTLKRSARQRYVWPEKALSLVRSTRTPKKDGAVVVKQLQEITMYPEKVCWRLAERHGFRRPHFRREWSREDIELILKMCESDRPVTEIAEYFGNTAKTIHQKIIKNGKKVGQQWVNLHRVSHLQRAARYASDRAAMGCRSQARAEV